MEDEEQDDSKNSDGNNSSSSISNNASFLLDLICLAQRRELINLTGWLKQRLMGDKLDKDNEMKFAIICVQFLTKKIQHVTNSAVGLPLDPNVGQTFLSVLTEKRTHYGKLFTSAIDTLMPLMKSAPKFAGVTNNMHVLQQQQQYSTTAATGAPSSQAMTVDKQASKIFQQIYGSELQIDQAITMMRGMKYNSQNLNGQAVYQSMLNSLFKEWKYLGKYPEKELTVTAQLFGQLISNSLMEKTQLADAMHMIHKSIQPTTPQVNMEATKKLFTFGTVAIRQFLTTKLIEYTNMTKLLTESDNLLKNNSELHGLIVIVRKKQLAAIALKEKVKGVAKGTKSSKGSNSKSATSLDRPEGKDQKEEKEEESKKQTVDDGKPKILQPLVSKSKRRSEHREWSTVVIVIVIFMI